MSKLIAIAIVTVLAKIVMLVLQVVSILSVEAVVQIAVMTAAVSVARSSMHSRSVPPFIELVVVTADYWVPTPPSPSWC